MSKDNKDYETIERLKKENEALWNELQEIKNSKGYKVLDKVYRSKLYQGTQNRMQTSKKRKEESKKRRELMKTYKKYESKFHMSAKEIYEDVKKCEELYGASFEDYELLRFYELPDEKRKTYVTEKYWRDLIAKVNDMKYDHYFIRKIEFYEKFKKFMGNRDCISTKDLTKEEFLKFAKGKEKIVYKPAALARGIGVHIVHLKNRDLDQVYQEIMKEQEGILDEYIEQHPYMKKLSPAVNTVRVTTLFYHNKLHIISATLRMALESQEVDNFDTGGVAVALNQKTGKAKPVAITRDSYCCKVHPKSHIKIANIQIPYWKEILKLIQECTQVVPEIRYVGWDVAITKDGPILVEGNSWGSWHIYQLTEGLETKEGLKNKFESILNDK